MPERNTKKTGERLADGKFAPGASGNPGGRPKGSRGKASVLTQNLLSGDAEAIVAKVISMAKDGDKVALKLVIERMIPRAGRIVTFALPSIERVEDVAAATSAVIAACAAGDLTTAEAESFFLMLRTHMDAMTVSEFSSRIEALEVRTSAKQERFRKGLR